MTRFKAISFLLVCFLICNSIFTFKTNALGENKIQTTGPIAYFYDPAISPDKSEIVFVSGGDIWTVSASGGEARLLVSHPANETRPVYSPDGKQLAFISNRTGGGDIYVLTFATGEVKRLTFDDSNDQLDGWSRDGRWIYFSSTSRDIAGMNDIFRVNAREGGTPMQVSADRYTNEFFSAPSPDGKTVAFTARGIASGQWWRKGHSNIDTSEIWLWREGAQSNYEKVTEDGAKELWPMWSGDGKELFYVSDRSGAQNIWTRKLNGQGQQVTNFKDGRVLWPSITTDGRIIVFERDFRIWKLDTESKRASEVSITLRGAPAGPIVEHLRYTDQIQEFALSPDGKKVAFIVRGEVFAASATDGGDAARVSNSVAGESGVAWSPDSKKIVYSSERDRTPHLFLYDFTNNTETQLTNTNQPDLFPRFSPDGKLLAFQRGTNELRVLEMESKKERAVTSAILELPPIGPDRPFVWSPDNKWIAFLPVGEKQFSNVYVVNVETGKSGPVSFLANVNNNTVSWSPDGAFLLYVSSQRTETASLARVDLIPRTPQFREDQFRDLFREETPRRNPQQPQTQLQPSSTPSTTPGPASSPSPQSSPSGPATETKRVDVVFEGIRQRLSLLPVGVDVFYEAISPNGKQVLMIAGVAGQTNIYVFPLDELSREPQVARQITSTAGFKRLAQFTPDGKEIVYLEGGRINAVNIENRQTRQINVTAEIDVDFAREKMAVFNQAWGLLNDHFYDSNFHGVNWTNVRATYEPLVAGTQTPDVMRRLLSLMVGELNASHLGVGGPASNFQPPTTGRLGLRYDRAVYEQTGKLKITEIIALSPSGLAKEIKAGQFLLAVDGQAIDAKTNLDDLLNYKINRRVNLAIADSPDGANKREIVVKPVNSGTEKGLLYRQWVEDNRAYIEKISDGRLGYVHLFDMSAGSLQQLYIDLDAENHKRKGVVIDVRNNNGGFVNVYAIDVFARQSYLIMTPRGLPSAPGRSQLGQRTLEAPTILITNRHSLSDAEDFTEGYRSLKLGKVVGEPTAGWIIYTWNTTLIDGTSFRLPRMKVTTSDGVNMELNPRPVDLPVKRPIGESYTGRDSQLDEAVRELLTKIK
jgi:Tol biopolymer transport system component